MKSEIPHKYTHTCGGTKHTCREIELNQAFELKEYKRCGVTQKMRVGEFGQ